MWCEQKLVSCDPCTMQFDLSSSVFDLYLRVTLPCGNRLMSYRGILLILWD